MNPYLNHFIEEETGAVTVDWVVLTAAVIGLGVAVTASVGSGSMDLAGDIKSNLTDTEIASYIPITFGDVAMQLSFDPGPRDCTNPTPELRSIDSDGNETIIPAQPAVCSTTPQSGGSRIWYEMSDGTQWSKLTTHTTYYETSAIDSPTTSETTVVWYDQDGTVVDAPEAT